jgi:DNA-binding YbaB/EbfC family protein
VRSSKTVKSLSVETKQTDAKNLTKKGILMFDKMKQLMEMQKKMQEMKRELDNTNFDITSSDGLIKITMNGSQEIKEVGIQADTQGLEKVALEKSIKDAYNRAIKRSHDLAAEKMKHITGFNLPGLL